MPKVLLRLTRDRVLDGVKYPAGFALGELVLTDGVRLERLRLCISNNACAFEEVPAAAAPAESVDEPPVVPEVDGPGPDLDLPAEPGRRRRSRGAPPEA